MDLTAAGIVAAIIFGDITEFGCFFMGVFAFLLFVIAPSIIDD